MDRKLKNKIRGSFYWQILVKPPVSEHVMTSWYGNALRSLSLCEGNPPVTGGGGGGFRHKGQVTQSYNVSLDLNPSKLFNKQSNFRWFETWRSCDFTLMKAEFIIVISHSHVHHSVKLLWISYNCNGNFVVTTSFTKLILVHNRYAITQAVFFNLTDFVHDLDLWCHLRHLLPTYII